MIIEIHFLHWCLRVILSIRRIVRESTNYTEIIFPYYNYCWSTFINLCQSRPPLWSSHQSSWLQIERSGFDFWHYHIFWEVVGLVRDPFSLVSTIEELYGRNSSGSCLESREYGRRDPLRWPRDTLYQQRVDADFADKQRSLGRYSSLVDSGH
jgi:hypothetical protein